MRKFATLVAASLVAFPALAHGPQIQVTNDGNKITTRQLFPDGPYNTYPAAPSAPVGAYVMPLAPTATFGGTGYFAQPNAAFPVSDPGIGWGYGWTFTDATHYTTTFPVGSHFVETLTGGLQQWNGSAFVPAAHGAQVELFRSGGTPAVGGTVANSISYSNITAPTSAAGLDPHGTAYWQLLGDGIIPIAAHPPAAVDNGVYLQQVQLSIAGDPTNANIQPSDPFYVVLYSGVEPSTALAATRAAFPTASVQAVPEPSTLGLAAVGAAALLRRRRSLRAAAAAA